MGLSGGLFGGAPRQAKVERWPELPASGFVRGRAADARDMESGDAVFLAIIDGKPVGVPATFEIPQYAWFAEGRKRRPVVVVQAEDTPQGVMVGMRDANGAEYVATAGEVELLGATHL